MTPLAIRLDAACRSIGPWLMAGVDESTGGNRRGINGGAFYFLRLPATGLEVDLPLIGTFPQQPEPDTGIQPNITIPRTAEAIAGGRDPVMEAALT